MEYKKAKSNIQPTKSKSNIEPKEITSIKQFKEIYFPSLLEKEKEEKEYQDNYGNVVAMSILEGIRQDLKGKSR